jgi:hypothetical protein
MKEYKDHHRDPVLMNIREFLHGCLQPDIQQGVSTVKGNVQTN